MASNSEDDDEKFTLEDFPPELLQKIWTFLFKQRDILSVSRVSRKLRVSVLEDPSLWHALCINTARDSIPYAKLISEHCPTLKRLTIDFDGDITGAQIEEMFEFFVSCEFLEQLYIFGKATSRLIEWISSSFPNLTTLCVIIHRGIYSLTVEDIRRLKNLESLVTLVVQLPEEDGDAAAAFQIIAENFPKLEDLILLWSSLVRASTADRGVSDVIDAHKERLKKICFSGHQGLTDATYKRLGKGDLRLEVVDILNATLMSDSGLEHLQKSSNLKKLSLGRTELVTSAGWLSFFQNLDLPKLEEVVIEYSNMCDDGIAAMATKCTNLKKLTLAGNPSLTDFGIREVTQKLSNHLVYLSLDEEKLSVNCLLEIPGTMTRLKQFEIYKCVYNREEEREFRDVVDRMQESGAPSLRVSPIIVHMYEVTRSL